MKQISNYLAIVLTALLVPGGLPIVFAIWAYRRRNGAGCKTASSWPIGRLTLRDTKTVAKFD